MIKIVQADEPVGTCCLLCKLAYIIAGGVCVQDRLVRTDLIEVFKKVGFYFLVFKDGFDNQVGIGNSLKITGTGDTGKNLIDFSKIKPSLIGGRCRQRPNTARSPLT